MATSNFQSGALSYAKAHGIALIKVYDYKYEYLSHSAGNDTYYDEEDPFGLAERMLPPYKAKCYFPERNKAEPIYPTRKMIVEIYKEANRITKEQYGFEIPIKDDEN